MISKTIGHQKAYSFFNIHFHKNSFDFLQINPLKPFPHSNKTIKKIRGIFFFQTGGGIIFPGSPGLKTN